MQTLVFSTLAGQLGVARGRSLGPSPFNSNHQELSQVQGLKCTNFAFSPRASSLFKVSSVFPFLFNV